MIINTHTTEHIGRDVKRCETLKDIVKPDNRIE